MTAASSTMASRAKFRMTLQAIGIDQAARGVQQRHVHRNELRLRDQVVHRQRLTHTRAQRPGVLHSHRRVEAIDGHAQLERGVRHLDADRAKADDAQRTARQLKADELLLARLHRLMHRLVIAFQLLHEVQRLRDVARGHQHRRQHQFLHGVGVGARCIEHRHAALAHRRDRDVVGAGTGTTDRLDRGRDVELVHVGRAHQHRIRILDLGGDFIALARQALETVDGDVVEGLDLEHGFLVRREGCGVRRNSGRVGSTPRPSRLPPNEARLQPRVLANSFM